jgi:hypothetical protein
MASNLGNLIVPSVFEKYAAAERLKLNRFVSSGAAIVNPRLSALLAGGANVFNLPFWSELSATGLVPTTDYAVTATPQKMAASSQKAVRIARNITPIVITELEGMLIGEDPIREAAAQVAAIQADIRQTSLMQVLASVTALDSSDSGTAADLLYDDAGTSLTAAMLVKGVQSVWGDRVNGLAGMTFVMNSLELLDLQLVQLSGSANIIVPNQQDSSMFTFQGATIVVDDSVADNTVYVIRRGGLSFGTAPVASPIELDRLAGAGNGSGADVLYARDLFSYHVSGTSFTGTAAGDIVTDAELGTSTNWGLVKSKKLIGVMKLTHAA